MWFNTLESPPPPGLMKEISIEGVSLVVTNVDSQFYCFVNRCPHEEFNLSHGCIKDSNVRCALHGYEFNLNSGNCSEEDIPSLVRYPVKVKDELVFVQMREINEL